MLALNCQYPPYVHDTTTLPWAKRVPLLVAVIVASGASVVSAQEIGRQQCDDLLEALGSRWSYRKALNGINAVFWRDDWSGDTALDCNLPSFGQSQRTLLVVKLAFSDTATSQMSHNAPITIIVGSTHFAAKGPDLTREKANVAKLAQVQKVCEVLAKFPQIIVGADLARTDDTDDLAYLVGQGWTLNGRTNLTPQVTFSRGLTVGQPTRLIDTGKACDHDAVLTPLTIRTAH